MRIFTMYRKDVPDETHPPGTKNAPDEPQFQGVQFDDGTVVIRWMTAFKSTTHWDSMEDMLAVHGHPEYDSVLVWHDVIIKDMPPDSTIIPQRVSAQEQENMAKFVMRKTAEYHEQQKRNY